MLYTDKSFVHCGILSLQLKNKHMLNRFPQFSRQLESQSFTFMSRNFENGRKIVFLVHVPRGFTIIFNNIPIGDLLNFAWEH